MFEVNVIKEKSADVPLHYIRTQQWGPAFKLGGDNQITLITIEMVELVWFSKTQHVLALENMVINSGFVCPHFQHRICICAKLPVFKQWLNISMLELDTD